MCSIEQLELLNVQMGMQGILFDGELRFYTHVLLYRASFTLGFNIERFNRLSGTSDVVLTNGNFHDAANTLGVFQPFLTTNEINSVWSGVEIPQ